MLSAAHRNQANSPSQCSERKTWLFLLHVRAGMERVLFIWNITCLYSDWISRFNSMLVRDCLAPGWEQGFELWLFPKGWGPRQLVSQRDGLKAAAQRSPNGGSWSPLSSAKFYWEHFTSDVLAPWQIAALKLPDSCPSSPCSPQSDLCVPALLRWLVW